MTRTKKLSKEIRIELEANIFNIVADWTNTDRVNDDFRIANIINKKQKANKALAELGITDFNANQLEAIRVLLGTMASAAFSRGFDQGNESRKQLTRIFSEGKK